MSKEEVNKNAKDKLIGCLIVAVGFPLLGMCVVSWIGSQISNIGDEAKEKEQQRLATLTPEQKEKEEHTKKIEDQFNPWDGSHRELVKTTKDLMNDPNSFEHSKTSYIDMGDSIHVVMEYRGKNRFGGVVKEAIARSYSVDGYEVAVKSDNEILDAGMKQKGIKKTRSAPATEDPKAVQKSKKEHPITEKLPQKENPEMTKRKTIKELAKERDKELQEMEEVDLAEANSKAKKAIALIKLHLIGKKDELAREKLKQIIDKYPGTESAEEAKELLKSIKE